MSIFLVYLNKQVGVFEVFRLADSAEVRNVVHHNDSGLLRGYEKCSSLRVLLGKTILILPKKSAKRRIKKSQSRNLSLIAAARGRERAI